jgi:hypothetical protein
MSVVKDVDHGFDVLDEVWRVYERLLTSGRLDWNH